MRFGERIFAWHIQDDIIEVLCHIPMSGDLRNVRDGLQLAIVLHIIGYTAQGVDYASGQTHQPGVVQHQPAHTTGYDSADIEIEIFKK